MAQKDDVYTLYPETLFIGTNATHIINAMPFQNSMWLQYGSGGTLFILGSSLAGGSSFANSQRFLVSGSNAFPLNFPLSGSVQLLALGATVVCYVLRGLGAGSTQS